MRLTIPPLTIEKGEQFNKDLFDRKPFGDALSNVVLNTTDELVVVLNSSWGEGKTTFLRMWQGMLEEKQIPNIYIDAFAIDFLGDAFVSIAGEITAYAEENIVKDKKKKIKELIDKTKTVGGSLASWTAHVGIKAATLGIIRDAEIEELSDIKNEISSGTSRVIEKFIEERITTHKSNLQAIDSFRGFLATLPPSLSEEADKPLVVIIDELDRCKPTFAVEIIEVVKHLFSVPRVVFILAMHKPQLEEAIRCVYGKDVDSQSYLQKFIHLECNLPKRTKEDHRNDLTRYTGKLLELHELNTWGDDRNLIDCVETLANRFNLSLRQLEKVFSILAVFYSASAENHMRLVPLMSFLAVIKIVDPIVFNAILLRKISFPELVERLNLQDAKEETDQNHKLYPLMSWVRFALLSSEEFANLPEDDEVKGYGKCLIQYHLRREGLASFFAQRLSTFVTT